MTTPALVKQMRRQRRCDCPDCCCCQWRGQATPLGSQEATYAHAGIDATAIMVPSTPGSIRSVDGAGGGGFDSFYGNRLLTLSTNDPRPAKVAKHVPLDFCVVRRSTIQTILNHNRSPVNPCFREWPMGHLPIQVGGDIGLAYLPECLELPPVDENYVYPGSTWEAAYLGKKTASLFSEGQGQRFEKYKLLPNGSYYDHVLREFVIDDWLLVIFDGDVLIQAGNTFAYDHAIAAGFAGDSIGLSATVGLPGASINGGIWYWENEDEPSETGWYARTVRVEAIGDRLVTGEPRNLTRDVPFNSIFNGTNFALMRGWMAGRGPLRSFVLSKLTGPACESPTYPYEIEYGDYANLADLGLLFNAPAEGAGFVSYGSGGDNIPWDEIATTTREKPLLAGLYHLGTGRGGCETDAEDDAFANFDGLYPEDEVARFAPPNDNHAADGIHTFGITYNVGDAGLDATLSLLEYRGAAGVLVEPNAESFVSCRDRCIDVPAFNCKILSIEEEDGPIEEFQLRRLTEEDVEANRDIFDISFPDSFAISTQSIRNFRSWAVSFGTVIWSDLSFHIFSTANGYAAWWGVTAFGARVLVWAYNARAGANQVNLNNGYNYGVAWYIPDPDRGGIACNVANGAAYESIGNNNRAIVDCPGNNVTIRIPRIGRSREIVNATMPNGSTPLVSVLFEALEDEIEPPDVMPNTFLILRFHNDLIGDFSLSGDFFSPMMKIKIDGSVCWVKMVQSSRPAWWNSPPLPGDYEGTPPFNRVSPPTYDFTWFTVVRGLAGGSHTIELPVGGIRLSVRESNFAQHSHWHNADAPATNNPVTITIDERFVHEVLFWEDVPYNAIELTNLPVYDPDGTCGPFPGYDYGLPADPCGYYGMTMRGGPVIGLAHPIALRPFNPDVEVQS